MACDERNHRALEAALTKMREERNSQTKMVRSLHGNVVGLEAKVRNLETDLRKSRQTEYEALSHVEQLKFRIAEICSMIAEGVFAK
jgi:chromosome segregation ATPase